MRIRIRFFCGHQDPDLVKNGIQSCRNSRERWNEIGKIFCTYLSANFLLLFKNLQCAARARSKRRRKKQVLSNFPVLLCFLLLIYENCLFFHAAEKEEEKNPKELPKEPEAKVAEYKELYNNVVKEE